MRSINRTVYQTRHLRAFATRVAALELDPADRKALVIKYKHGAMRGAAWISAKHIDIYVPRPEHGVDKAGLAMLLAHEMAHVRGRKDERMMRKSPRYGWWAGYQSIYAWANDLPLGPKEARPKPPSLTPAEVARRETQRVAALIKKWETKHKRATNALRKYRAKLRYHTRRAAALGGK